MKYCGTGEIYIEEKNSFKSCTNYRDYFDTITYDVSIGLGVVVYG